MSSAPDPKTLVIERKFFEWNDTTSTRIYLIGYVFYCIDCDWRDGLKYVLSNDNSLAIDAALYSVRFKNLELLKYCLGFYGMYREYDLDRIYENAKYVDWQLGIDFAKNIGCPFTDNWSEEKRRDYIIGKIDDQYITINVSV